MRNFETGATRDSDESKYDYEGFLSPTVMEAYAAYMHTNRFQADGKVRDSDNWQKGIPLDAYMKSMFRHFMAVWKGHRNGEVKTEELAALMFNVMGYMHEKLKEQRINEAVTEVEQYLSTGDVSPRAQQNAWDESFTVEDYEIMFKPVQDIYTHRYGALAHDAEAIEDEAIIIEASRAYVEIPGYKLSSEATAEEETHNEAGDFTVVYKQGISVLYPHNEGYESTEGDVARLAGVDRGEVVGLSAERVEKQVEPLATKVQGVVQCQAPLCGCKW